MFSSLTKASSRLASLFLTLALALLLPASIRADAIAHYENNTPTGLTDAGTTISTIVVSGAEPYLRDVNLQTFIRHTFSADLDITLTSPSGTVVTLTTDNGGAFDNVFNGTVWDDSADPGGQVPYANNNGLATDRVYANNVVATPLVPEGALGAFIGENPNGVWTLSITDDLPGGQIGTLDAWSLDLATWPSAPAASVETVLKSTGAVTIPTEISTVTSQVVVSGLNPFLLDVNLQTFITHSYNSDLDMTITSPQGTVVTLSTENGASLDDVFNGTVWDDDGAVVATDAVYQNLVTAPSLVPEEALGAFFGENPNGTWTLTVSDAFRSDGGAINSWSLHLRTEVVPGGEIAVSGNGVEILDGSTAPTLADHTDFGAVAVANESVTRTFTVSNLGASDLTLGSVVVSGAGGADFNVITQPASPVPPGGSVTFQVAFDPSVPGLRTATLSLSSSDDDEPSFDFAVQGQGLVTLIDPLHANLITTPIPDNGTTTSTIVVSGAGLYLRDLNLQTFIRHTWSNDLDVTLTSPSGTTVVVTTDNGGSFANVFNGTIWDDSANPSGQVPYGSNGGLVTDRAYASNALASPLVPEGAFGKFIGENPNGTWTLSVTDDGAGQQGTLDAWSIALVTQPQAFPSYETVENNTASVVIPITVATVSSQIVVSGAFGSIIDVNLQTFITHSYSSDLDMTLTSPSGTVVTLTTDNGGVLANVFNGTVWDDSGAVPATDAVYTFASPAASLIPEEALAAFIGENANGTWTLTISDDGNADGGTLDSWSLKLRTEVAPSGEIAVSGNGVDIANGDVTPSLADHTDFGIAAVRTGSVVRTFTIENAGSSDLTLFNTSIGGADAADFTITVQPGSPVAAGGATTFQVTFAPSGPGPRNATAALVNSDGDENPFTFAIQGLGIQPEIALLGNGVDISNGDVNPEAADGTAFGSVVAGNGAVTRTFMVLNGGSAGLTLGAVTLGGVDAAEFAITMPPASFVSPGDSTSFEVIFEPGSSGLKTATVSLVNDDGDESPFTFSVQGLAIAAVPEIRLEHPAGSRLATLPPIVLWGLNSLGQSSVPAGLTGVVGLAGGTEHTVALKADGTVAAWGSNALGQTDVPVGLTDATAVTAGASHSVALRSDGTVVAWGDNAYGQASVPSGLTDAVAIGAGLFHTLAVRSDHTVVAWGDNAFGESTVPPDLTNVVAIGGGWTHSVALRSDGTVAAWGNNVDGELDMPAGLTDVSAVSVGAFHTLALKADGTVAAWGYNGFGQTQVPAGLEGVVAVAAGGYHSMALRSDGTVVAWGNNDLGQTNVPPLEGVTYIAAAYSHSMALAPSSPSRIAFASQVVGLPSPAKTFTIRNVGNAPLVLTQVGVTSGDVSDFTVDTSGTLASVPALGETTFTVAFTPGGRGDRATTLRVLSNDSDEGTYDIALSGEAISPEIVVTGNGAAIADGDTTPSLADHTDFGGVNYGSGAVTRTFTVSNTGNMALTLGQVSLTGGPSSMGFSVTAQPASPVAPGGSTTFEVVFDPTAAGLRSATVSISSDDFDENPFTFVVRGTGTGAPEIDIVPPPGTVHDEVVEWGNTSGREDVIFGGSGLRDVKAGVGHRLGLRYDGTVVCWPDCGSLDPPTGLANVQAIATRWQHNLALLEDGTVVAWGRNDEGQTDVPPGLTGVVAIATGAFHSLALKSDGTVVAWGGNILGSDAYHLLDVPPGLEGVVAITAGVYNSVALLGDGTVVGWPADASAVPVGLTGVVSISAGEAHALGLKNDGTVVAWGANGHGQADVPSGLTSVVAVAAGQSHSLALRNDGSVVSWGWNQQGQSTVPPGLPPVRAIAGGSYRNVGLVGHHLNFEPLVVGTTSPARTFTIRNTGDVALHIDDVSVVGAHASDFSLDTTGLIDDLPATTGETSFAITFAPSAPGPRTATLRVLSSDGDESVVNIWLTGVGIGPEITVSGFEEIVDGDTTPGAVDGTDFGSVAGPNGSVTHPFFIANSGSGDLTVETVTVSGPAAADFTLIQPAPSVASGDLTQFYVTFAPSAPGLREATVSFANNDSDENPFTFAIQGTGTGAPEIVVEQPAGSPVSPPLVAWGLNDAGQSTVPASLANVVKLAVGRQHSVALRSDGTVVGWGLDTSGQVSGLVGLSDIVAIAAGGDNTLTLKADGTVAAWGNNDYGQASVPVGLTGVVAIAAGMAHSLALKDDGTVVAWGDDLYGESSVPADLTGVIAIGGGWTHSLALKSDGTVRAWGGNGNGELDVPEGLADVVAIAAGGFHSLALRSDGTVVAWGYNDFNQAAVPVGLTGVVAIAAGGYHSLALKADGTVVGWGNNDQGQTTVPPGLSGVTAIGAGYRHSLALSLPYSAVSFGDQAVGVQSDAKVFTIRNTGIQSLELSALSVTGGDAADFTLDTTGMLTSVPAVSGETTFAVRFTPGALGERSTTLRILSNDADQGVLDISLIGTGVFACPALALASLPNGILGLPYTGASTASGGVGPYTYTVTSGLLPDGLRLTESGPVAGEITGTPETAGTFVFEITAKDIGAPGACSGTKRRAVVIGSQVATSDLVIREFRLRGPAGPNSATDEYVVVHNRTVSPITVASPDGSSGFAVASSDGNVVFSIPNGTIIPARGHYLGANTTNGPTILGVTPDADWSADIADGLGLALFKSTSNFTALNLLDAVGFTPGLYAEGTVLPSLGAVGGEYAWVRKSPNGVVQDTDSNLGTTVNPGDFTLISTDGTVGKTYNAVPSVLGAPSPTGLDTFDVSSGLTLILAEPNVGPNNAPNRMRLLDAPGGGDRLEFRRRITNNTSSTFTSLRIRFTEATVVNSPGYATPSQADIRPNTSVTVTIASSLGSPSPGPISPLGLTLLAPPAQPSFGGLNSILTIPGGPLGPGQSRDINIALRVFRGGNYRFLTAVEGR